MGLNLLCGPGYAQVNIDGDVEIWFPRIINYGGGTGTAEAAIFNVTLGTWYGTCGLVGGTEAGVDYWDCTVSSPDTRG